MTARGADTAASSWRRGVGLVVVLLLVALQPRDFVDPGVEEALTVATKRHKKSPTEHARNYLHRHAKAYRLGHYVRSHSAGLTRRSGEA